MNIRRKTVGKLGIFLCWLLSSLGSAQTLLLVTGENAYPPLTGPKLPEGGLVTEVVRQVFHDRGFVTDVAYVPWNRAYQMTLQHEAFATFPYVKDEEREKHFLFSKPLFQFVEKFFVRINDPITFSEPKDIYGKTICRPIGYTDKHLEQLVESRKIWFWRPDSLEACFDLLANNQVDLVPVPVRVGWKTVSRQYGETAPFKTLPHVLGVNTQHLMVSRSHPDAEALLKTFNDGFKQLIADGTAAEIFRRHNVELPAYIKNKYLEIKQSAF